MKTARDDFTRFEHEGWERAADKYDSVWSSLTRQFIPYLINDARVSARLSLLDVACGPGYVDLVTYLPQRKSWALFQQGSIFRSK